GAAYAFAGHGQPTARGQQGHGLARIDLVSRVAARQWTLVALGAREHVELTEDLLEGLDALVDEALVLPFAPLAGLEKINRMGQSQLGAGLKRLPRSGQPFQGARPIDR